MPNALALGKKLLYKKITLTGETIMRKRSSMSRRKSRKVFRKYSKTKKVNVRRPVMRGGIRF